MSLMLILSIVVAIPCTIVLYTEEIPEQEKEEGLL